VEQGKTITSMMAEKRVFKPSKELRAKVAERDSAPAPTAEPGPPEAAAS